MAGDDYSWTGGGDGASWSDPNNWNNDSNPSNTGSAPGGGDIAYIYTGAALTQGGSAMVLDVESNVSLSGSSLGLDGAGDDTPLDIGATGTGILTLASSASVSLTSPGWGSVTLGFAAGTNGTLNMSGNSTMTAPNGVYMASDGVAAVNLTSGAQLTASTLDNTSIAFGIAVPGVYIWDGVSSYHSGTGTGTVTVGGGATVTVNAGGMELGGNNTQMTVNAGGVVNVNDTVNGVILAPVFAATDTVTVTGAGAVFTDTGVFIAGQSGTATVNVAQGGKLSIGSANNLANTDSLYLGELASSDGTMTVTDANTVVKVNGQVDVGDAGTGYLKLQNGASMTTGDATGGTPEGIDIGAETGGSGTFIVQGSNTRLTNTGQIVVGEDGAGVFTIANGAQVTSSIAANLQTAGLDVAVGQSSEGTVNITGAGSSLTVTGDATVGEAGVGRVNVDQNATLGVTSLYVANAATGAPTNSNLDTVYVTDGAALTVDDKLVVGAKGHGLLAIQSGGVLNYKGDDLVIGQAAGAAGELLIQDSATKINYAGPITIGDDGFGKLSLDFSATLTSSDVTVAAEQGSQGVAALGQLFGLAQWTITGDLTDGDAGAGDVEIDHGSSLMLSGNLDVAAQSGSSGSIEVLGPGSSNGAATNASLNVSGTADIGDEGYGSLTIDRDSTATFKSSLTFANDIDATAAATITGGGTLNAQSQTVTIGQDGSAVVNITQGGLVDVTGGTITLGAGYTGEGELNVDGAFPALLGGFHTTNTSELIVGTLNVGDDGYGQLTVSNGAIVKVTDKMTIGDDDVVNVQSGGSLTLDDDLVVGSGASLNVGGKSKATNVHIGGDLQTGAKSLLRLNDAGVFVQILGDARLAGAQLVNDDNTLRVSGSLTLSPLAGDDDTFIATDAGTQVIVDNDVTVGDAGTANINVLAGASFNGGGALVLGSQAGGSGAINISGDDSIWTAGTGDVTVGDAGNGDILVQNGGNFDASVNAVTIAEQAGATGSLTVSNDGSEFDAQSLTVADDGVAALTISDGGAISVGADLTIADGAGSTGTLTIADAQSSLDVGGDLTIGGSGDGVLTDDGDLSVDGEIKIGEEDGGAGTFTLNGATFDASDSKVTIGDAGNGLMIVQQGSTVTVDSLTVGAKSSGQGEVDVDGATLTSNDVTIGGPGQGTLKLTDGATFNVNSDATLGDDVAGYVQSALVDTASLWAINGDLTIGGSGIATATAQGEGQIGVAGNVVLGDQSAASGVLVLSGHDAAKSTASNLAYGKTLTIGNYGDGDLTILAGGEASATGSGGVEIAAQKGGEGSATVSGAGSSLKGATLDVGGGAAAAGGLGRLSIASGGAVSISGDAHLWNDAQVTLSGAELSAHQLTIDQGADVSGAGTIAGAVVDNGLIAASGGVLDLSGNLSGSGTVDIGGGATLELDAGASGATILFEGDGGTLQIGDVAGVTSTLSGFAIGDSIELAGVTATSAQDNGGNLDVYDGANRVASFAVSGNYAGAKFNVGANADGSAVTLSASQPPNVPVVASNPIGVTTPASVEGEAGASVAVNELSVNDSATGSTVTVTLLTETGLLAADTNAVGGGGTIATAQGGDGLVISGSVAQVNADLSTVTYLATAIGGDTLQVIASDSAGDADASDIAISVPDTPPSLALPGAQTVTALAPTAIAGIDVTDAASTNARFTVTVSDSTGALAAREIGASTVSGAGGQTLTIEGDLADVDADLASLTYTGAWTGAAATDSDSVKFSVDDGSGGTAAGAIGVTIDAAPDQAPLIEAPNSDVAAPNTATALAGVSLIVAAAAEKTLTVTLSDASGTLFVAQDGASAVTGLNTGDLEIVGNLADVNADLASLTYTNPGAGDDAIHISVADNFGGAAQAAISIETSEPFSNGTVAPSLTLPGAQTVTAGAPQAIVGVDVSDPSSTNAFFSVTVSALTGALAAVQYGASTVVGDGSSTLLISGDLADINDDLAGLSYTGASTDLATSDADTIAVTVINGNGVAASGTIAVTIDEAPGSTPTILAPGSVIVQPGAPTAIADVYLLAGGVSDKTLTVVLSDASGFLSATQFGASTVTGAYSYYLTISGDLSDVNADLASLAYEAFSSPFGSEGADKISIVATDNAGLDINNTIAVTVIPAATEYWALPVDGNFDDAGNWTPNGTPGAEQTAVFTAGAYNVNGAGSTGQIDVVGAATFNGAVAATGIAGDYRAFVVGGGGHAAFGAGASLTTTGSAVVGQLGSGALTIDDGATATLSGATAIGPAFALYIGLDDAYPGASVTVDGAGTSLTTDSGISIGGAGSLSITDGASVSIDDDVAGFGETVLGTSIGSGTLDLSGGGSSLTVAGLLLVGDDGVGYLNIGAGATLTTASAQLNADGGEATVTITGAGAAWNISKDFAIGASNPGSYDYTGDVTVKQGGALSFSGAAFSIYGDLNVTDSGSLLAAAGADATVALGSFEVENGADANLASLTVNGEVAVGNGANTSTLDVANAIALDGGPQGGELSIYYGGVVDANQITISGGGVLNADGGALDVTKSIVMDGGEFYYYVRTNVPSSIGGIELTGGVNTVTAPQAAPIDVEFAAGSDATLSIASESLGTVSGFDLGDTLDLTDIEYNASDTWTLQPGNELIITAPYFGSTVQYDVQLDPTEDLSSANFLLNDSGSGTVDVQLGGVPGVVYNWAQPTDDDFENAAAWTPSGGPPALEQTAVFGAGAYTVSGPGSAGELDFYGDVALTGALAGLGDTASDDAVVVDQNGSLTLAAGASLTAGDGGNEAQVIVGDAGTGALTVDSGANLIAYGSFVIGDQATSVGTMNVEGRAPSGVQYQLHIQSGESPANLIVGDQGQGSLTVDDSSWVDVGGEIDIGAGASGFGTVNVDDATFDGTTLAVGGTAQAAGGAGALYISNIGTVDVSDATIWAEGTINLQGGTFSADDEITVESRGLISGSGLIGSNNAITDNGVIAVASNAALEVAAAVGGAGSVSLGAGSTLRIDDLANDSGGSQTQDFNVAISGLTASATIAISIYGLGNASAIDDYSLSADGADTALTLIDGGDDVATLTLVGDYLGQTFDVGADPRYGNLIDVTVMACYCRGTSILTERGEVAVEDLAAGDLVVTASGETRPIKWIGHRAIDVRRHPKPQAIRPVRVFAGAFGDNAPSRDLWLSPGHNIASEGVIMPVGGLINGLSVRQEEVDHVEYWHVELDRHDIILAEGLPAESYLDTGNRTAFANGGAFVEAHPDFQPKHWAETCLPLALEGPAVAAARARLLARLVEQGCEMTREADAHVVVDGLRVEPIRLGDARLAFVLPSGGRIVELRSRTFIPAHSIAHSNDRRTLGLCVGALQIDGSAVDLADDEVCGAGWRRAETEKGRFSHRWTGGASPLPAGARVVVVDLVGEGRYWRRPDESFSNNRRQSLWGSGTPRAYCF